MSRLSFFLCVCTISLPSLLPAEPALPRGIRVVEASRDASLAVLIGIDHYSKSPPLAGAVKDVERMAELFEGMGFSVARVTDTDATSERLKTLFMKWLPQEARSYERVVVYFAGHGATDNAERDDNVGYLIPRDVDMEDPNDVQRRGVSMKLIHRVLGQSASRHTLILIDACFSGLALPIQHSSPVEFPVAERRRWPLFAVMTAGRSGERAFETKSGGLFTHALVDALSNRDADADSDRDQLVSLTELFAFVQEHTRQAAQRGAREQLPQLGRVGLGEFVFPLPGTHLDGTDGEVFTQAPTRFTPAGTPDNGRRRASRGVLMLDVNEVTVGDFRHCVSAGICKTQATNSSPLCTFSGDNDRLPMNCVSAFDAHAYCRWRNNRLPTAAEWRSAAFSHGGDHPWGRARPDCQRSVMKGCGWEGPAEVGSLPMGRSVYGHADLIGNVREWTVPAEVADPYTWEPTPVDLLPALGGSWHLGSAAQSAARGPRLVAGHADPFTGFRCARVEGQ